MISHLRIATRKSPLALWQSHFVADQLKTLYPEMTIEILGMSTQGDRILDVPLAKIGGKGLFTKELEVRMQDGEADIAVHSMKDLPAVLPEGFHIAAVLKRHAPTDAFVSNQYATFDELPHGAVLGTSSLRRRAQLQALRPDLKIIDLRGNVQTRLAKLDGGEYDAIILATSGLQRLGLDERIRHEIAPEVCLPAVSQGALAIECQTHRADVNALLLPLQDAQTQACTLAERAMNHTLEGGCQVPIGCFAIQEGDEIWLRGLVASLDGQQIIRNEIRGPVSQAQQLGEQLGQKLLAQGAQAILAQVYAQSH